MNISDRFDIHIFDSIPDHLVQDVDQLLEANESNNRIRDERHLSDYSKERFDNKKDRMKYIVTLDHQKVVGIIILLKREITFHGKRIVLGGIGGVGTKNEYRRQGIATAMLHRAKEQLEKAQCEIAFLCTDIHDPVMLKLYGSIGFVSLNRTHTYVGRSGKNYIADDAMIAPMHSQATCKEVLEDNRPFDIGMSTW